MLIIYCVLHKNELLEKEGGYHVQADNYRR